MTLELKVAANEVKLALMVIYSVRTPSIQQFIQRTLDGNQTFRNLNRFVLFCSVEAHRVFEFLLPAIQSWLVLSLLLKSRREEQVSSTL